MILCLDSHSPSLRRPASQARSPKIWRKSPISRAAPLRDGAQLLLTPELSASGYGNTPEVLATAEPAGDGPIYERLSQTARETGVVICAGFVEQRAEKKHLAHTAIFPDGRFVVQRKHRITRAELPLEPNVPQMPPFNDWDGIGQPERVEIETFEVAGVKCAIAICADSGIENLNEILLKRGVELLLLPVAAASAKTL